MIWALVGLGLAGCVFVVIYAVALRRKYARTAREANLLRTRADELRAILDRWDSGRGD
ncbi:MAG: hypothetical protein GX596_00620 [Propionibacterium sp.]|nr:hypothetical protein [Propionibacterium sp.]